MKLETAIKLKMLQKKAPIPVRMRVANTPGKSNAQHFSRGSFLDIRGDKLVVKPYKHGKKELYNPEYVHLWTSRAIQNGILSQAEVDIVTSGEVVNEEEQLPPIEIPILLNTPLDIPSAVQMPLEQEQAELQQKLESSINTMSHVIADLGLLHQNTIRFYEGKGSDEFTESLLDAFCYEGPQSQANASRSLSHMKRNKSLLMSISDIKNLRVITFDRAKELYDDTIQKKQNTKEQAAQPEEMPTEVIESQEVETVIAEVKISGNNGHALQTNIMPEKIDVNRLGLDTNITDALRKMQTSMMNVQTAIDMLKEEKKNLQAAQQQLVGSIASRIQLIDREITNAEDLMIGK